MKHLDLDYELDTLKENFVEEMPEIIRTRLDQTYQMLDAAVPYRTIAKKKRKWLRHVVIASVSVAAAGVIIIGSGFISPAMAQTLKQIPFVESVFKFAGDLGLQAAKEKGLTTGVNQSVTHKGLTLSVSELMYDGSRLSLVLTREVSEDSKTPFLGWWIGERKVGEPVNNIDFYINGELKNTSWGISSGGDKAPNSIIVETFDSGKLQVPDEFEFTMVVRIAKLDQDFEFKMPVKKKTKDSIVLTSDEMKSHENIYMKINKVEMTPATTRLVIDIKGKPGQDIKDILEAIPDKYKIDGFLNLDFDLTDDQGRSPKPIGGSGSGSGDSYTHTNTFEPFATKPNSVTIKPYIQTGKNKEYIPELEFTLPVK